MARDQTSSAPLADFRWPLSFALVASAGVIFHYASRPAWPEPGLGATWYKVNIERMQSLAAGLSGNGSDEVRAAAHYLASCFVPSELDGETREFLEGCATASRDHSSRGLFVVKKAVCHLLQRWLAWSQYDANTYSLLKTLFVASTPQFRTLLGGASLRDGALTQDLLDVGAGDGEVTRVLAEMVLGLHPDKVVALDTSSPRLDSLAARGYRTARSFAELDDQDTFGIVSLLNVLDRCDSPLHLLSSALRRVRPGGVLLVATVLPFCGKVFEGKWGKIGSSRKPRDALRLQAGAACESNPRVELGAAAFAAAAFGGLPVTVRSWTRVPYLCSGDSMRVYEVLDQVIYVLQAAS